MWERKTKTAKWNGVAFNIQKTTLDTGKRLHVVELPYADEPYIKVMGAKAKGLNLDAVFVGADSLVDANAFVSKLESDPVGSLEHPYLGEMSLVYQSASQSFSTKKGLVTLSLKFLKQGKGIVLTRSNIDDKPVSQLSDEVMKASTTQFVRDIGQASPQEIHSIQNDFTQILSALTSATNRVAQGNAKLTHLQHQIQRRTNEVNTIVNAPASFANQIHSTIKSVVDVLPSDASSSDVSNAESGSLSSSKNVVSVKESARKMLSRCIKPNNASSHCNNQIVVALVLLSNDLVSVGVEDELSFNAFINNITNSLGASSINNSINKTVLNINELSAYIDKRIDEATVSANYESLALVDSLTALRESVNNQSNKIEKLLLSIKSAPIVKNRPLLCIAQSQECTADEISILNPITHPLFVNGTLRVPSE